MDNIMIKIHLSIAISIFNKKMTTDHINRINLNLRSCLKI